MTTETPTFQGPVRILDPNGWLLTVGVADLSVTDPALGTWGGTVTVFRGSAIEGKSLTAVLRFPDGRQARVQLGAEETEAGRDMIAVKVVGLDPPPF